MKRFYKRFIYLSVIICIVLITSYYDCAILRFTNPPSEIPKEQKVVFLYYDQICSSCDAGKVIKKLDKEDNILFILSSLDYKPVDISKLKDTFLLKNRVILSSKECDKFISRLSSCMNRDNFKANYVLYFYKKKNYKALMIF